MLPDHSPFLQELFRRAERQTGSLDHLFLDHICFRVTTIPRYHQLRDALCARGDRLLAENPINGRPIATFALATPLRYQHREIPLLELPAPKPGSDYAEGFEHIELVTDRPLTAFADHLPELLLPTITALDRRGMAKARNADLRLRLGDGYSIKFHEQSLAEVIRAEAGE